MAARLRLRAGAVFIPGIQPMRLPLSAWKNTLRKLGYRLVRQKTPRPHAKTRNSQLEILERREVMTTQITHLGLANDTGASSSDLVTTDPTLTVTVAGTFAGYAEVQFDHEGNQTPDGQVQFYSPGTDSFDPRNSNPSLMEYSGSVTIHYRWVEFDEYYTEVAAGTWTPFTFTLEQPPNPELDVIDEMSSYLSDGGSLQFETTEVGAPLTQTLTIENWGTTPLFIDLQSFQAPSGFTVTQLPAATVPASGQTTLTLRFDATEAGNYSGPFSFVTNDADESPFNLQLSGTVEIAGDPEIEVWSSLTTEVADGAGTVSFGSAPLGAPARKTFTIKNTGLDELTLDFDMVSPPMGYNLTELPATVVLPGGQTTFSIQLDGDGMGGIFSGEFSFSTNDPNEATFDFDLSGRIVAPQEEDQGLPSVTLGRLADEEQQIVVPAAGGGTWRIGLDSAFTVGLAPDARRWDVQAALENLAAVGIGNVTVAGAGTKGSPFSVKFGEAFQGSIWRSFPSILPR